MFGMLELPYYPAITDDGANDVMIGEQNDDYYRHNSSNRHEASLVV